MNAVSVLLHLASCLKMINEWLVWEYYMWAILVQVRFINCIPMQFLHTPYSIPSFAARYLMLKIVTITTGINKQL